LRVEPAQLEISAKNGIGPVQPAIHKKMPDTPPKVSRGTSLAADRIFYFVIVKIKIFFSQSGFFPSNFTLFLEFFLLWRHHGMIPRPKQRQAPRKYPSYTTQFLSTHCVPNKSNVLEENTLIGRAAAPHTLTLQTFDVWFDGHFDFDC